MKLHRVVFATVLVGALAACGSDKSSGTKNITTLTLTERLKLASSLETVAATVTNPVQAAGLEFAAAVVATGGNVTGVTVNAALASVARPGSAGTLSQPVLAVTPTAYRAIAVQVHNLAPNTLLADTGVYSAILLFKDSTDYILTFGEGQGTGNIPDNASTIFWTPPNAYWDGISGTATLNLGTVGGTCPNFTPPGILGATITCQTATLTGGVNITSAAANNYVNGNTAEGVRSASLSNTTLAGYYVTITPTGQ